MKGLRIGRIPNPPLGCIIDRYLLARFSRTFFTTLAFVTTLYLTVDVLDLIDNLLNEGASLWTAVRYFIYKTPLLLSRVFGFATLFATFLSVGVLARQNEISAFRTSGLSLRRLALPFLVASLIIGVGSFFWAETLVPAFTRQAEYVYEVEVKKQLRSGFGKKGVWIRGKGTFVRADSFDAESQTLHGLVIYLVSRDFTLEGMIQTPVAHWDGRSWNTRDGVSWQFADDGTIEKQSSVTVLPLQETPQDFNVFARTPEEFGFFDLKQHINDLRTKGINTTEHEVDLQMKLAISAVSPLMALLAVPFALKQGRRGGLAWSFALTMLIGFGYWATLGFCVALGKAGAFAPWISAWLPNLIVLSFGLFFFSGQE